jgi:ketosteroid isomerase-like protein
MSENDAGHLAQAFLKRMGGGAKPSEVAALFSEHLEWGRIIETDFVVVLTVANSEIIRFQMFEDSFAVARAARA